MGEPQNLILTELTLYTLHESFTADWQQLLSVYIH